MAIPLQKLFKSPIAGTRRISENLIAKEFSSRVSAMCAKARVQFLRDRHGRADVPAIVGKIRAELATLEGRKRELRRLAEDLQAEAKTALSAVR